MEDGTSSGPRMDVQIRSAGGAFAKNATIQDARNANYDIAYAATGAPLTNTSKLMRRAQQTQPPIAGPAKADATRRVLADAEKEAALMLASAQSKDVIALANHAFALLDDLETLWKLRPDREEEWADLVNLLQGTLGDQNFEVLTVDQCQVLHRIISKHLCAGTVGIDNIRDTVRLLSSIGLHPWKPISGPQADEL